MDRLNLSRRLSLIRLFLIFGGRFSFIVFAGIVGISIVFVAAFLASGPNVPSDNQLLALYTEHKAEFARLEELFTSENDLLLVYPDSGRCETIGRQRVETGEDKTCDEYLHLFRSLGLDWAYIDKQRVYLSVYRWGLTGHGVDKGYLFAPNASDLGTIVENTGDIVNALPRLRAIEENWYIFFK